MKYSEFIEEVSKLNTGILEIVEDRATDKDEWALIRVYAKHNGGYLLLISISKNQQFNVKVGATLVNENILTPQLSQKIYELATQLAATPLDDRKDVQLYAVRSKGKDGSGRYEWVGDSPKDKYDHEFNFIDDNIPKNSNIAYLMPLSLAKKHLTAFRELVKVED